MFNELYLQTMYDFVLKVSDKYKISEITVCCGDKLLPADESVFVNIIALVELPGGLLSYTR